MSSKTYTWTRYTPGEQPPVTYTCPFEGHNGHPWPCPTCLAWVKFDPEMS